MAIIPPAQKQFPKAPEGVHRAVCVGIYDVGTQTGGQFGPSRKVILTWELSDELMENDKPFTLSETFTLSLNEKANLRKKIEAWRGKPLSDAECARFDVGQMLGRPCQLQVIHNAGNNGQIYANIGAIMSLPKGMTAPETINDLRQFSIDEVDIPPDIPKWVAEKIRNSQEWQAKSTKSSASVSPPSNDFDEFADRVNGAAPVPPVPAAGSAY